VFRFGSRGFGVTKDSQTAALCRSGKLLWLSRESLAFRVVLQSVAGRLCVPVPKLRFLRNRGLSGPSPLQYSPAPALRRSACPASVIITLPRFYFPSAASLYFRATAASSSTRREVSRLPLTRPPLIAPITMSIPSAPWFPLRLLRRRSARLRVWPLR
jgi:hypothetical protein